MLLVANLASTKGCKRKLKIIETLASGYSSESSQRELSNEYQYDRVKMGFKNVCVLVLWTKVASALEGLRGCFRLLRHFKLATHDWSLLWQKSYDNQSFKHSALSACKYLKYMVIHHSSTHNCQRILIEYKHKPPLVPKYILEWNSSYGHVYISAICITDFKANPTYQMESMRDGDCACPAVRVSFQSILIDL